MGLLDFDKIYQQSMGRDADQAGKEYWGNQISSGNMTADQVKQAITGSAEAKQYQSTAQPSPIASSANKTAFATTADASPVITDDQLNSMYQQLLGRSQADAGGMQYWRDSGMSPDQIHQSIYDSAEAQNYRFNTGLQRREAQGGENPYANFQAQSDSIDDQINAIYKTQLGREVDQAGLDYWREQANSQGLDSIKSALSGTAEYRGYNAALRESSQTPLAHIQLNGNLNPEIETVQGQLNSLLSNENPLMQRAYYKGLDYANGRGLLNSSIGAEAAQAAMIDASLPIAQQDASTYFSDRTNTLNREHDFAMLNAQQDFQREMEQSQQDFQRGMQDSEVYANFRGQLTTAIQDLTKTASINISEIQTSQNISAEDKATMIEQQQALLQSLSDSLSTLYSQSDLWQQGWSSYLGGTQ